MVQISNTMDTASIVAQLVAVERIPQDQLKQKVSALQSKQNAWGQISSAVNGMQNAAESLAAAGSLAKLMSAASGDESVFTARVTGAATASTSNISVTHLAATHAMASTDVFAGASASAGGRTITLDVAGTPTTFTSADGTIGGLVSAINAGSTNVKAKLLQTGTDQHKLVLTATRSGAAASFTATGSGWTGLTTSSTGRDASFTVDGVAVTRSTNIVTDAIAGVELTLKAPGAVTPLTVTQDVDTVVSKVQAFVDAANNVLGTVKAKTLTSSTASSRGALAGDSSARGLADDVRNAIASGIDSTDGILRPASTIGISLTKEGTIRFDASKLRDQLAEDPSVVAAMLGRAGTTNVPNVDVTSVLASASPGPHAISITQIASASALVGVPIPPPPDGSTINMTITTPEGSFTVTFNAGATYAQTAANLTQAMTNAGLSLEATTDDASFSLIEKRPGSRHTFAVTSGASDLGLTQPLVNGNDARVSFAGTSVTGDGSTVISGGVALRVGVTAGALATAGGSVDGTYTVHAGLAAALARVGGNSTTGAAKTARDGLDSQIKTLNERIARYDDSLKMKQDQLTAKFTAMDTVLTRLQAQMTSLVNFTTSLG